MNPLELTGRADAHVVSIPEQTIELHRDVVTPFRTLCDAARADGIQLAGASGFRSFERQVQIWNAKLHGQRQVFDRDGVLLDTSGFGEAQLVEAVLAWTALPGASRHHWGSDIDVYDAAVTPPGPRMRLTPSEWEKGRAYGHVAVWLDKNMGRFGFYRPYDRDRGGVCAEPWHISHIKVSSIAMAHLRVEMIADALAATAIAAKETVQGELHRLFDRYVCNVAAPAS
jgi:LAS superfamily LD-carboxypeptidase LdcB